MAQNFIPSAIPSTPRPSPGAVPNDGFNAFSTSPHSQFPLQPGTVGSPLQSSSIGATSVGVLAGSGSSQP